MEVFANVGAFRHLFAPEPLAIVIPDALWTSDDPQVYEYVHVRIAYQEEALEDLAVMKERLVPGAESVDETRRGLVRGARNRLSQERNRAAVGAANARVVAMATLIEGLEGR